MSLEWEQTVVDSRDPAGLGRWWASALGWVVVDEEDPEGFEIRPEPDRLPGLLFLAVPDEEKAGKNRLHLAFRPADPHPEVDRLVPLGATRVAGGQRQAPGWGQDQPDQTAEE